jgi:hypothetical protein
MVLLEFDQTTPPRKRAVAEGARAARDALALVGPINEKIGSWQAEAVRLETSALRMRAAGRHNPGIIAAIETLLGYVEEQAVRFEVLVAQAAPEVAMQGRVTDTRRGLTMLAARLHSALGQKPG